MAKKQKNLTKYEIETLHMEIDYEKLADALKRAMDEERERPKKRTSRFRSLLMSGTNVGLHLGTCGAFIFLIIYLWREYAVRSWSFGLCIGITAILSLFALLFALGVVECMRDDDKDAREHFNTSVSLAALVVVLAALFLSLG